MSHTTNSCDNQVLTTLTHPCTPLGKKQYTVLIESKASGNDVHKKGFDLLKNACNLDYKSRVLEIVDIGPGGSGRGHDEFMGDSMQIWHLTLMFAASNDGKFAEKAIGILDTWIQKCKVFKGSNAPLEVAWGSVCMIRSAEILKYNYKGWKAEFEKRLNIFVDTIFLPNLRNRYNEISKWNNNWILSIQEALFQIATFKNDIPECNRIITEFKKSLVLCVPSDCGHCTETKRDLIHAQFQIGSMIQIAEMCWHQGVDLYSYKNNLILKCMEYHAMILNGGVPNNIEKDDLKDVWFMPSAWDVGFNHYMNRKKMQMPHTTKLLSNPRNRPERLSFNWGPGWIHYCSF
jgi:hypothetical protein